MILISIMKINSIKDRKYEIYIMLAFENVW